MFKDLARALASVAAIGLAAATGGCSNTNFTFDGHRGVPLAELDLSGKAPAEVALLGPDRVNITEGAKLAISVEGDAAVRDKLRFVLDDGKLGIARDSWSSDDSRGIATVNVTMPPPRKLVMAGSGEIDAAKLAGDKTAVDVLGSGKIVAQAIETGALEVNVAGSGTFKGAGSAKELSLKILGSGDTDLSALKAGSADIKVAGSGNARFASDGDVHAKIMGSGDIRVTGHATCTVKSLGSGKLVCEAPGEA